MIRHRTLLLLFPVLLFASFMSIAMRSGDYRRAVSIRTIA